MNQAIIIIPCYNEADRLDTAAFEAFVQTQPQIHFLFVNDGSQDQTSQIIHSLAERFPSSMSTMDLSRNSGKAEAVRQGFLQAFQQNPEFIGYFDADLATPLHAIPELLMTLTRDRKDIAMGARVALLGRQIDRKQTRHYAGRIFATLASMILKLRVYDTQCGAKIFRVTDRLKTVFFSPFTVRWIFDVEILARFILTPGPRVEDICVEYPLREWADKKGSKLKPADFLISGLDLLKIASLMRRKTLPGS